MLRVVVLMTVRLFNITILRLAHDERGCKIYTLGTVFILQPAVQEICRWLNKIGVCLRLKSWYSRMPDSLLALLSD